MIELAQDFLPVDTQLFAQDTRRAARALVGCAFVHNTPQGPCGGILVETEAYLPDDPACHAARGKTPRCAPMFMAPGTVYVYLCYGIHFCVNLVTQAPGEPAAVLLRALMPVWGQEQMYVRRAWHNKLGCDLARGPGRLCQALGINVTHNAKTLQAGSLMVLQPKPHVRKQMKLRVRTSGRIGIRAAADKPWRFYAAGHPCVSAKPR